MPQCVRKAVLLPKREWPRYWRDDREVGRGQSQCHFFGIGSISFAKGWAGCRLGRAERRAAIADTGIQPVLPIKVCTTFLWIDGHRGMTGRKERPPLDLISIEPEETALS